MSNIVSMALVPHVEYWYQLSYVNGLCARFDKVVMKWSVGMRKVNAWIAVKIRGICSISP